MNNVSFIPEPGSVYFIGAGPGAPDLISIRGRDIIAQADLILYADSLVAQSVADLGRKPTARIVGSADLHLEQIVALMIETAQAGGVVARVHSGDPALYGATLEQMALLEDAGVPYSVVPGITAAFAAAARLGVELTVPELVQTIILTRAAGRTPMPEGEELRSLAAHGSSVAIYLSITRIQQVVTDLLAGGAYTPETPVAVLHKVTWPDESMVMGTLRDIVAKVRAAGYNRQALILVSPTLDPALKQTDRRISKLYDQGFTHGFRRAATPDVGSVDPTAATAPGAPRPDAPQVAIITVTRAGTQLAARLAQQLQAELIVPERFVEQIADAPVTPVPYSGSVVQVIRRGWGQYRQLLLVMATGIAVRAVAPRLGHKAHDPAVVCMDETGSAVIPLLGGHQAGANELARQVAALTGGQAAITTASDVQHKPALDQLGRDAGWRIAPGSALTHASACLVNGEVLGVYLDPVLSELRPDLTWLEQTDNLVPVASLEELNTPTYAAGLIISQRRLDKQQHLLAKSVLYHPPQLVVGMGCRRGVPAAELRAALEETLADADLALAGVAALATVDLKADEPGLRELAAELDIPLQSIARERLAALDAGEFSPSAAQEKLDLPGVAEPCAQLASGGNLLVPKRRFERCTVAIALRSRTQDAGQKTNVAQSDRSLPTAHLALVSIGPGDPAQMTPAAREALTSADVIIGYQTYVEQVRPLLASHQEIISRAMKSEMERAAEALARAAAGRRVALISSGDIGVYAMAGPVFELLHQRDWPGSAPEVVVLPGVSALQAAAARLGAAINHDFCAISLSDLLTPWELIERRLWSAARGDFVVALYNPRSRERHWQLGQARSILLNYRPPTTPAAIVRNVTRPDETLTLTTLAELDPTQADMFSLVLIGNSQSYRFGERIVTPRGYAGKNRGREQGRIENRESEGQPSEEQTAGAQFPVSGAAYPITLTRMAGVPVLVVGGGAVGERKVAGLLAVGAAVRLISPQVTTQLAAWAEEGRIRWEARAYRAGELAEADAPPLLVFATTNQRAVNAQVAGEALAQGRLCNVADVPEEGTFHLPALQREAGLTIAVSTDGTSPARARQVRDQLAAWLRQQGAGQDM
jgi:cobalt-precorrin 5A hydrolase / precorrin-3B C17-methyltransferase